MISSFGILTYLAHSQGSAPGIPRYPRVEGVESAVLGRSSADVPDCSLVTATTIRYDDQFKGLKNCRIEFTPTQDLTNPKIYYQLENFYAKSQLRELQELKQLRDNLLSASDIGTQCDPVFRDNEGESGWHYSQK
jgi:hypothetical protein